MAQLPLFPLTQCDDPLLDELAHGTQRFDHGQTRVLEDHFERGGPVVAQPLRKGFGHTVIEGMVAASTGGKVQLDFAPEGLSWTLSFPAET